jgi:hypothetical protein
MRVSRRIASMARCLWEATHRQGFERSDAALYEAASLRMRVCFATRGVVARWDFRTLLSPRAGALTIFFSVAFAAATALGHGGATGTPPIPLPPAPPGDGAKAERILKQVQSRAADARAAVNHEPIESAKRALQRAHGARSAGDTSHARMLDALALQWAEMARDLERAATVEATASTTGKQAKEAAAQVERARALLEETQARRGRAEAELQRVEVQAREAEAAAKNAEQARLQAAASGKKGSPTAAGKSQAKGPSK